MNEIGIAAPACCAIVGSVNTTQVAGAMCVTACNTSSANPRDPWRSCGSDTELPFISVNARPSQIFTTKYVLDKNVSNLLKHALLGRHSGKPARMQVFDPACRPFLFERNGVFHRR